MWAEVSEAAGSSACTSASSRTRWRTSAAGTTTRSRAWSGMPATPRRGRSTAGSSRTRRIASASASSGSASTTTSRTCLHGALVPDLPTFAARMRGVPDKSAAGCRASRVSGEWRPAVHVGAGYHRSMDTPRLTVALTIDHDAISDSVRRGDPPVKVSHAEFGPRVGAKRILALLERRADPGDLVRPGPHADDLHRRHRCDRARRSRARPVTAGSTRTSRSSGPTRHARCWPVRGGGRGR